MACHAAAFIGVSSVLPDSFMPACTWRTGSDAQLVPGTCHKEHGIQMLVQPTTLVLKS
jgi:hypothetical protein